MTRNFWTHTALVLTQTICRNMPIKGQFKDYVLGTYDGIPKDPKWASQICGTPVSVIEELAMDMATTKPMSMKSSFAPARTYEGARFAQAYYTVGWMTGNVGISGAEVSVGTSAGNLVFGGPPLVYPGDRGLHMPENPVCEQPRGGGALGAGNMIRKSFMGLQCQKYGKPLLQENIPILKTERGQLTFR